MFVPAKTPRAIVEKLHSEATKALATESVRSKLEAIGVSPMSLSPREMDIFIQKQITADAALVKSADIRTH